MQYVILIGILAALVLLVLLLFQCRKNGASAGQTDRLQRLLEQQREDHYAVLYTDFADFKYFNDVYGYTFGDDVLAHYGGILSAEMREGELFGRVAADNFVLLLRYREKGEITVRQRRADREIEEYLT